MTKEQKEVVWWCVHAVAYLALLAAFVFLIAWRERCFRRDIQASCPSGTALRVCEESDAELEKTTFGRWCVQFTRTMRKIGGDR